MPRKSAGPRLYFEKARRQSGKITRQAVWVIRDGARKASTRCGASDREQAEKYLADYITNKYAITKRADKENSLIPDALNLYAQDIIPKRARPKAALAMVERILKFWGDKTVGQISTRLCNQYVEGRGAATAARRELELMRAALGHFKKERHIDFVPHIEMPECGVPRDRWLTREEVVRLLWAAWRLREEGKERGRHVAKHVARFILAQLYTVSRPGVVCEALIHKSDTHAYLDLATGIFYRQPRKRGKNKKRRTTIRVPDRLLAHARRWHRLGYAKKNLIEWRDGVGLKRIEHAFRSAVIAAKLDPKEVTPHVLRHTGTTWLRHHKVDPWQMKQYASLSNETLDIYAHESPDYLEDARAVFDRKRGLSVAETVAA